MIDATMAIQYLHGYEQNVEQTDVIKKIVMTLFFHQIMHFLSGKKDLLTIQIHVRSTEKCW